MISYKIGIPKLNFINEIWDVFGPNSLVTLRPFWLKGIVMSCVVCLLVYLEVGCIVKKLDCNPCQTNVDIWYSDSDKFIIKHVKINQKAYIVLFLIHTW